MYQQFQKELGKKNYKIVNEDLIDDTHKKREMVTTMNLAKILGMKTVNTMEPVKLDMFLDLRKRYMYVVPKQQKNIRCLIRFSSTSKKRRFFTRNDL